jgi:hypothetical protein
MVAPQEGPAPMYSAPPPDQQPMSLEQVLMMADTMIWQKGAPSQQDRALLSAFYQTQLQKMQAAAQQYAASGNLAAAGQMTDTPQGAPAPGGIGPTQDYNGGWGGTSGGIGDADSSYD